ncbi:mitochondrial carrier [Coniophora puteana RWD-64-598 SS2]|uniref:Mitochondrial carrier n=1 Tax=Coniophora puteana (strain RWD-64-598) TaxID=741705 RepID=A0A5M3M8K4_CONPW|nr:mitochondrial carrier [Coniophora puteana RWD-64-598 SS2]EIW75130.1 mitochondrial carrier [Coniophora puteana RWD-64-598 SS2]
MDFVAGTASGIAGLLVGHPLDTVKVRFQNPDFAHRYTSTLHAVVTIAREERLSGLWKGVSAPLATYALLNGLIFSSYRFSLNAQLRSDQETKDATLTQIAIAGAACGVISSIITSPVELIKTQQQNVISTNTPSAWSVIGGIVHAHGLRGLYRGWVATALRDTGYSAYFWAYEGACRLLTTPGDSPSMPALILAGAFAGVVGWGVTFPMDVVKTRMQSTSSPRHSSSPSPSVYHLVGADPIRSGAPTSFAPLPSSPLTSPPGSPPSARYAMEDNPYRTVRSTIVNSYRSEGVGVFVRGLSPTVIRAIPVNAAIFVVYEWTMRAMEGLATAMS